MVVEGIPAVLGVVAGPVEDILVEEEVLVLPGEVRLGEEEHGLRLVQSAQGESPRAGCSGKCCSRHPCIHVSCEVE